MEELNLSMFRAYDIRTPAEALTEPLARRLARAEALYFLETLGARGVLLAHDARLGGPGYLEIGADEFRRAGLDVLVLPGVSSTSLFYFAAMQRPERAAVMYGASHNPARDTGQKLLAPRVRPIAEEIGPGGGLTRIRELYRVAAEPVASATPGRIAAWDPLEEYVEYSSHLAGVEEGALDGLPVLMDYLNGAAGREMMVAFQRAGARLEPLHFPADGRFPLGDPNPVKPTVVAAGLERLGSGSFRLGFLFDGDGDRMDVYSGDGRYLASSFVFAGVVPELRRRFPGPDLGVFADLKGNPLALIEIARSGFSVEVIRNGHSQIKHAMYQNPRMVATVEESAHFYEAFPAAGGPYCTENTLYMSLLVSRCWQSDPGRFERLLEIQAGSTRLREWGHHFPNDEARAGALAAVRAHFEAEGATARSRMENGMELEATLMRRGLPFAIDARTKPAPGWLQICQRVSQSEDGLARWEVSGADPAVARAAREAIERIVREFGAGPEYVG